MRTLVKADARFRQHRERRSALSGQESFPGSSVPRFSLFFFRITDGKRREVALRREVLLLWLMKACGPDRLYANGTRGASRERLHGELYMNPIDVWSPGNAAAVPGTVRMSSSKTTWNTEAFHT